MSRLAEYGMLMVIFEFLFLLVREKAVITLVWLTHGNSVKNVYFVIFVVARNLPEWANDQI